MRKHYIEIIHTLMRFLIIHNAAAFAMSILKKGDFYIPGMVLLAAMLLFAFFRSKVKNGTIFTLLHIAVFMICFVFSGMQCAFLFFTIGTDMILSMRRRFYNVEIKSYSGLITLLFAVGFMVNAILGLPEYLLCCAVEAVLFTVFKFVLDGMMNTEEFIAVNEKIADMPTALIRKRINIFLLIFVAVAALTMAVGMNSGLPEIFEDILGKFLGLFEGIFRRRPKIEESQVDFTVFSEKLLPDMSGMDIKTGRALTPLAKAIGKIMLYAGLMIFGVYMAKSVILKLKDLVEGLYASEDEKDVSEFIVPKDVSQSISFKRRFGFAKYDDSLPNDAKIRKLYKKYIMRAGKAELPAHYTPNEISNSLGLCSDADKRICEIYEKAKYAGAECTLEEISEFKTILKKSKY